MATVKFRIRTKTDNSQIFLRFSISRKENFETKTGFTINANDWSFETSKPKQTKAENKILSVQLRNMENHIQKAYNEDLSTGISFSTEWLKIKIAESLGRDTETEEEKNDNLFLTYLQNFIELRKIDARFKKSTNQKFVQLEKKIKEFEKKKKTKFNIMDFDKKLMLEFRKFVIDTEKYMESSANRLLKNVKTVLLDARDNGKNINHQINSFTVETISAIKIFLDFAEIQKIKESKIVGDDLQFAKDWLIIGCYTGQRISDLLRMNKGMIYTKTDASGESFKMIELTQEKTGQEVSIPLHDEVIQILDKYNGSFPPTFSEAKDSNFTLFNRHIKKVCELAGITNKVKGRVWNDDTERNEITETEKYNLVSSHICRRSFATNFYGDKRFTTPQIMAITGHKQEKTFLGYIGKTSSDHALQTAKTFREISEKKKQIL